MNITNPILRGFNPDPSVCSVGADYYLTTSTFNYHPGCPIYHSRDLGNWRLIGHALTQINGISLDHATASHGIFAPTLRYHNGTFYLITTNVGGGGNFYVTAKNPAGPWSQPVWLDKELFDPSLLFDDDGKVYYTRRGEHGIVQAELDLAEGRLLGEPREISKGVICDDAEGPHLYKIGRWYYLVMAEGGTRFGHSVMVSRSASPWGPFEPAPHNPMVTMRDKAHGVFRDSGHGELFEDHTGRWWMVCLGTRHRGYDSATSLGRETFLMEVTWVDEWPVIEKSALPLTVDTGLEAVTSSESFNEPESWVSLRGDASAFACFAGDAVTLQAGTNGLNLEQTGPVSFVGKRQREFAFGFSAWLDARELPLGGEAGVTVYMRSKFHYDMTLTRRETGVVLRVRKFLGDIEHFCFDRACPEAQTRMVLRGDRGPYRFGVSADAEGEPEWIASGQPNFLSAENASCWTGMVIAMFAQSPTGEGSVKFSEISYRWE